MNDNDWLFDTAAVRTQVPRSGYGEHAVPIYMTSSYLFDSAEDARARFAGEKDGPIYSRYTNPNTDEFIDKMCQMEGCEDGISTASGMAAVFASLASFVSAGDHILACRSVFGSTHQILTQILSKWGITHSYADIDKTATWEGLIQPNTKLIYVETPSNPGLDLIDLEWLGALGKKHGLIVVVDNCFATPYLQRPADFGCQIIVHSATKFIDGQGRALGGIVLGPKDLIEQVRFFTRHTGPSLSPFHAWIFSKSLETLSVRMDRHCQNALELAKLLEGHPAVAWVKYPGLPSHPQHDLARKQMKQGGGLVTFELRGGLDSGRKFLDALKFISVTANLGDSRSTATHPASTTHSKLSEAERLAAGITPGLVRISAGLEALEDLKKEVLQALASAG